jgi:23S rRNA pseudouridine1911/1915/1917 synthase
VPFRSSSFIIEKPIPAFLFVMRTFHLPMKEAQRVVGKGRLLQNGKAITNPGARIVGEVEVIRFIPAPRGKRPLLATPDFAVFDKPSGVLVHPNKTETPYSMLDEIRALYGENANAVHRIDMETSGLLLVSRHKKAETLLKSAFEHKAIRKSYLAWVHGRIDKPFRVDAPILKNDDYSRTKHKVFIDARGKSAVTDFTPLYYDAELNATLLECRPLTGRTHQIRIHLFHVKHPILGDPIYTCGFEDACRYLDGETDDTHRRLRTGATRLMLHAHTLRFEYEGVRYFIESRYDFLSDKQLIAKERELKIKN